MLFARIKNRRLILKRKKDDTVNPAFIQPTVISFLQSDKNTLNTFIPPTTIQGIKAGDVLALVDGTKSKAKRLP